MATKFLEPGGDSTFNVSKTSQGGFWSDSTGGTAIATDFVHGSHIKSVKYPKGNGYLETPANTIADAGSRISFFVYFNALPGATSSIIQAKNASLFSWLLRVTSGGVLQLTDNNNAQIGSNGTVTVSAGTWYRISVAYTITDTTHNRFEIFVNGVSSISVTNGTLVNTGATFIRWGNNDSDTTMDLRSSDHYIDNSAALTDPGNIWVTAKRPNANGTTNGFTTQIGAGGSGYGTGHSPQVNERPLSATNGWSMVGAGSAVTEEYNIESTSTGDINISTATIVDWLGWVDIKSAVGETVQVILNGANTAQAITSTETLYTVIKGSATYPAGTGADLGVITDTSLTTVSLYECGVVVAYIPAAAATTVSSLPILGTG